MIAAAEAEGDELIASRFDMIAGTSIGGILAIGLACGVPGRDLSALMRERGPAIFRPRALSFAGISRSRRRIVDTTSAPWSHRASAVRFGVPPFGQADVEGPQGVFRDEWDEHDKPEDRSPPVGSGICRDGKPVPAARAIPAYRIHPVHRW
jgi:predicted acylesterase/phospholipase RssA